MRRLPPLLLVLLVLNGLFLILAIRGATTATPGEGGIGAGLAAMAAIVTAVPLALAVLLALAGVPRIATAAALLPLAVVAGYQYLGVVGEREYARTLQGADDFTDPTARKVTAAVAAGNDAVVRELVAGGADLNTTGAGGDTILTFAVRYWPERVPLLLELGADPNAGAGPESGPLYLATVTGATAAVDALLRAGAKPDMADAGGTPVIFHALKLQDATVFDLFVGHGADVRGRDDRGYTLLMAAAWHRRWPQARMLLDRGIDPAAQSRFGDSVQSILETSHMDDAQLADPDYRAFIAALAERGVPVTRRSP